MHSRCLPFKFGVGERFFSFFPSSQCVSFKFPMGYIQVFNMFPKFSMCSPTCSPQHPTFIPYALANVVLLPPIQVGQRGGTLSTYIISLVLSSGRRPFHPSVPSSVIICHHPSRHPSSSVSSSVHPSSSSRNKKMMEREEDDDSWRRDLIVQHVLTQRLASVISAKSIRTFGGELSFI
jgi:hypothetical protein